MGKSIAFGFAVVFLFLFCGSQNGLRGQAVVSATVSGSSFSAGEVIRITLSVDDTDFYAASAEVSFDNSMLDFTDVTTGELSDGGLAFWGELGQGLAGVSVTRTTELASPANGSFMDLWFVVKTYAAAGTTEIGFSGLQLYGSGGEFLPSEVVPPVTVEVSGGVADISLIMPAENEIEEGQSFTVNGRVFASGLEDGDQVTFQVGVNDSETDPAGWGETKWEDMVFDGSDDHGRLLFSAEIAYMRAPGNWFVVVRASVDDEQFVYGGLSGEWDPENSPAGLLTILPRPPFRYPLAKWDFDNESYLPSAAVTVNRESPVVLEGASLHGFVAGYRGLAGNSRGWDGGGDGSAYWMVEISTSGFVDLKISSRQYSSGTGPRDFSVEYSFDGADWLALEGGGITAGSDWISGMVDRLNLPGVLENNDRIFLRWVMVSEASVNDGVTGSSGTSRIDDIVITGVNADHGYVTVLPGDTNNDGIVNADDVLPLGWWWLSSGPPAVWDNPGFVPRIIERWVPEEATFADANGDGVIDHRDLLPVGLHFGKSTGSSNKDTTVPLSSLVIDPRDGDRVRYIEIVTADGIAIRGVAFNVAATGIPADMWEIREAAPLFAEGIASDEMLSLQMPVEEMFECAFVIKGGGEDIVSSKHAGFELVVDERWDEPFTLNLNRLSFSSSVSPVEQTGEGELVFSEALQIDDILPEKDDSQRFLHIYPNPFSAVTTFSFRLDNPANVRIVIIRMDGRVAGQVYEGFMEAGKHEVIYDGSHLPPGMYLCRMISGNSSEVVKFIKSE